jgi:hypothetical protein
MGKDAPSTVCSDPNELFKPHRNSTDASVKIGDWRPAPEMAPVFSGNTILRDVPVFEISSGVGDDE